MARPGYPDRVQAPACCPAPILVEVPGKTPSARCLAVSLGHQVVHGRRCRTVPHLTRPGLRNLDVPQVQAQRWDVGLRAGLADAYLSPVPPRHRPSLPGARRPIASGNTSTSPRRSEPARRAAQGPNTDQQMSFRNLWSSSTSSRISSGSWSRCHWHSSRPAASLLPSGAAARTALIA